jgi:hypothetical protein
VILDSTSLFGLELRVSIRKIAISRRIGVDCTPTVCWLFLRNCKCEGWPAQFTSRNPQGSARIDL